MKGYIHIYCGDGKGKTTAATGLAIRMLGDGKKVLIARFLKNENSSELNVLNHMKGVEIIPSTETFGFYNKMSEARKREAKSYYSTMLSTALSQVQKGEFGLLFLDEIMAAYHYGLIDGQLLLTFLKNKPGNLEIVMTGRNPATELMECADYITEMKKIRHPYDAGIMARKGVEY